jgi:hypothetical protein
MAKSAKKKTDTVATTIDHVSKPLRRTCVTNADIARRAYDLYLTRGGEDGYDLDDWLHAERELRDTSSSAT